MRIYPCELPLNGKAIFYIGTHSCVPCNRLMPLILDLEEEYHGYVDFYLIDATNNIEIRMQFAVMGVPAFIMCEFRDGHRLELGRLIGSYPKEKYVELIKNNL